MLDDERDCCGLGMDVPRGIAFKGWKQKEAPHIVYMYKH